jgi:hypothetical protein
MPYTSDSILTLVPGVRATFGQDGSLSLRHLMDLKQSAKGFFACRAKADSRVGTLTATF